MDWDYIVAATAALFDEGLLKTVDEAMAFIDALTN